MDPVSNPYRPGAGNPPPALTGRDALLESFAVTLKRALAGKPDKSVMPIGLRGVGKTVLLNRFVDDAAKHGYVVGSGLIEARESEQFPEHLAQRMRRILLQLDNGASGKARRAVSKALGILSSFGLTLPDGTSFNLGLTPVKGSGDSGNLGEDITDLFVAAAEAASAQGRGVLIAIDEIQYLNNVEFGALISAVHRTTQLNLPLVLVGAGLPMLPGLAGNSKSYSERLFAFPVIGKLENKDAREAIVMPASDFDVTFTKQALAKIIDVTEGYPFFIQEWAHEIWNHSAGPQIRETDVDAVRSRVISKLDGDFFHVRLDRLTPTEKKYMRAMAQLGPGPHRSGDIAAIYDAKVETVAPLRASLIRKGMIYSPAFGDTAFTVPLFHDFLKRSLPFKKAAQ